ncbi:MAG TPA: hypothetical protein GX511_07065, partial [Firmicutes bacterium]|nr:hypothetical protein [Bacillota bacterium]
QDDQLDPTHWFWDPTKSGGIWVEHGVHFLDAVHWLLGPADWVWAAGFARPKEHLVERVAGTVGLESGCVVSYYHGFTKPEAFEDTVFALVWERAYGALHGWIPVRLTLDALVTPEVEAYLTHKALERARAYLPGVDVKLTAVQAEPLGEAATFRGRGKNYRATARLRLTYELSHDRWTVYRACVRQGLLDLAVAVRDPARSPAVTLADAEAALRVAAALTASAAGGQRVFL